MDLIIKGMDMPKSCFECRFYQSDMDYCEATGTDYPFLEEVKLKDCPLTKIPTPHGRLIDADRLIEYINEELKGDEYIQRMFRRIVKSRPTVIEAEE